MVESGNRHSTEGLTLCEQGQERREVAQLDEQPAYDKWRRHPTCHGHRLSHLMTWVLSTTLFMQLML